MEFEFLIKNKKNKLDVLVCKKKFSKFFGLMFKKKSKPLLFVFNKNKKISIHSFFCKPFIAIWLDENKKITKVADVRKWKPNFSGQGMYVLEIPFSDKNYQKMINFSSTI